MAGISDADARQMGVEEGDVIELSNDRGSVRVPARPNGLKS